MAEQPRMRYCRDCNSEVEEHRFDGYRQCNTCREKGLTRTRRTITCSCGRTLLACSLKVHLRSLYHAEHFRPAIQQEAAIQHQPAIQKQRAITKQQQGAKIEATQPQDAKKQSTTPSSTAAGPKHRDKTPTTQVPTFTLPGRLVFKTAQHRQ
jgi:hypothetical protein